MTPDPTDARRPWARDLTTWLALALAAATLVWRSGSLDEYWLNPDEGLYHEIVTSPSAETVRRKLRDHPHPPLFYWALWSLSPAPDGSDIETLRWPALAFSSLSIFLAFVLGRQLRDGWTGLAMAALVAASPPLHEQSLVIRQYAWVLPFLLGATSATLAACRRGSSGWLFLAACSISVALTLHYSTLQLGIVLAALFVFAWLRPGSPVRFRLGWLASLVPVIAASVWVWESNLRVLLLDSEFRGSAAGSWLKDQFIDGGCTFFETTIGAFSYAFGRERLILVLLAFGIGIWLAARRRLFTGLVLTLAVLVGCWVFSILELYPFGATRHTSVWIPFLGIPIALLARDLLGRSWKSAAGTLGLATALFFAGGPIATALGWDDQQPWLKTVPEQAVTRQSFEEMREPFERLALRGASVFLDQQALAVLHPLVPKSALDNGEYFGEGYLQIPWQTSALFVAPCWLLTVLEKEPGGAKSNEIQLTEALRVVAEERPSQRLGSSDSPVFVVAAGWYQPWMFGFSRLKKAAQSREIAISGVRNSRAPGGGIGIFRVDFPAWQSGRAILAAPAGD